MAIYTLFGQSGGGSIDGYTGQQANGLQFSVSQPCTLTAIWFYSAPGAVTLPVENGLFTVTGGSLVFSNSTPAWSGAAASGWVRSACSQALTAGTNYEAAVLGDGVNAWYPITSGYWTGSGITNGPLSCPNDPNYYVDGAGFSFPDVSYGTYNLWLDVEVTTAGAVPGPAYTASMASM